MFAIRLVVACLFFSSFATAQEADTQSVGEGGFFSGPPPLGFFPDGAESRFFELLRSTSHISQVPFSFEETVELSSAIARGYLIEVIPGRVFSRKRRPEGEPLQTILLKIQASYALKGNPQGVYLVQYVADESLIRELNEELYTRELLFLLAPASTFFDPADVEISTPSEAETELSNGRPVYDLTSRASLFTMSAAGKLTSPLGPVREFEDLYRNMTSLEELSSYIENIRSQPR